jgi:hypothetical protein
MDGFYREDDTLHARLNGIEYRFEPEPDRNRAALVGRGFELELSWDPYEVRGGRLTGTEPVRLDTALLWRVKTAWDSIFNSERPNMVNPRPMEGMQERE